MVCIWLTGIAESSLPPSLPAAPHSLPPLLPPQPPPSLSLPAHRRKKEEREGRSGRWTRLIFILPRRAYGEGNAVRLRCASRVAAISTTGPLLADYELQADCLPSPALVADYELLCLTRFPSTVPHDTPRPACCASPSQLAPLQAACGLSELLYIDTQMTRSYSPLIWIHILYIKANILIDSSGYIF